MNGNLDVYESLRLMMDAIDALVASSLRRTGDLESQDAERLARRARLRLDALTGQALREVS